MIKSLINNIRISLLIGAIISIIGGILGIIGLAYFGVFKYTIVQPYSFMQAEYIPKVRFTFGFYMSMFYFIFHFVFEIICIVSTFKKTKGKLKTKVPYDDLFDNWEEITTEKVMAKLEDKNLWGKILSYTLDEWYDIGKDYKIPDVLEIIAKKIKEGDIQASEIQDFISLILDELNTFYEKASKSEFPIDVYEIEYYLPIIGQVNIREAIPLVKNYANLVLVFHIERKEIFEREHYYKYRIRALEA